MSVTDGMQFEQSVAHVEQLPTKHELTGWLRHGCAVRCIYPLSVVSCHAS